MVLTYASGKSRPELSVHLWVKTKGKSLPGRTSKLRKVKEEILVGVVSALL